MIRKLLQVLGRSPLCFSLGLIGVSLSLGTGNAVAQALDQETLLLLTDPLNLEILQADEIPADGSVVTPGTIRPRGITLPSLWWTEEQFGGKVLDTWLAFSGEDGSPRRVDLIVNQQVWSIFNYLERYAFLNHFGTSAQDFGYNTRVFNRQRELLGAYICNFREVEIEDPQIALAPPDVTNPNLRCRVFLEPYGSGAIRGRSSPLLPLGNF